ncbi:MAG: transposase [Candidatus Methanoplasma sp.]|jgi:putative transposase|nr:transposase [Candidatus Methanoplasma sp.]
MARPEAIGIIKHMPMEELNKALGETERTAARASRVRQRLTFIRMRYLGYSVPEAAKVNGMTAQTGYNIQELWNSGGPETIEPRFGGGRPSRLTAEQKDGLKEMLRLQPMETSDVRLLIIEEYGIEYSMKQVHVILTKMGMHHAKPYPRDHRRPDDAEDILKKNSGMLWTVPDTAR